MNLTKSYRRRLAGLLCLFAVVGGAVLSPTAHFAYMWGSMGSIGSAAADAHSPPEDGEAHSLRVHHAGAHGPILLAAHFAHDLCEYADLLASSAPSAEASPVNVEPFVGSAVFLSPQESFVTSVTVESALARGPPRLS